MPLFRYEAFDSTGAKIEAYLQSADEQAVATHLNAMGYRPASIELAQRSFSATSGRAATQQAAVSSARRPIPADASPLSIDTRTRARMYHQLHTAMRAGLTPFNSLNTVAGQMPESAARQVLHEVSLGARDGLLLSDLMERYPRVFTTGDVGMVRAAEMGGFLPDAFRFLARQHEEDDNTARRLRIWIWFFHSNVLTFFLMIPLGLCLKDMIGALDFRVGLGALLNGFLYGTIPLTLAYFGGLWGFYRARHHPPLVYRWHRLLLRLPVVGQAARLRSMSVFTRTLQLLHHAGVANESAWETAAGAVPNAVLAEQFAQGTPLIRASGRFSEGMKRVGLFDPADLGMIGTGEAAGDLEQPLQVLADRFEEETRVFLGASVVRGAVTFTFYAFVLGGLAMVFLWWAYGQGLLKLMEGIE